jgi:hypothetical protein
MTRVEGEIVNISEYRLGTLNGKVGESAAMVLEFPSSQNRQRKESFKGRSSIMEIALRELRQEEGFIG